MNSPVQVCTRAKLHGHELSLLAQGLLSAMTKSQTLENIVQGKDKPVEEGDVPDEIPEWFDIERFEDGKKFVQKYLFCIALSQFLSLFAGLSFNRLLKPLIYSKNSETPKKALKRYALTSIHVNSWCIGNVFENNNPARKSIQYVRSMHSKYAKLFNKDSEKVDNATVYSIYGVKPSSKYLDTMKEDIVDKSTGIRSPQYCKVCSSMCGLSVPFDSPDENNCYLSQTDMSFTQFGFMGLLVMYPEKFGIHYPVKRELDGFIHMWKVFGYMLGIKDEYNFCLDDNYEDVRQLSFETFEHCLKYTILGSTEDYEFMASALVEGMARSRPGLTFQSCSLYLFDIVNWDMPRFSNIIDNRGLTYFKRMKFVFQTLLQYRACQWVLIGFHKLYVWWMRRFMFRSKGDYKAAIKAFRD
ncbi:uncharacterized protein LOC136027213 isoform X2 [Artemia franciscana]|uniref:uncharacterized protein LOC136027213 isoform X2 n=1 Tax=Artemia franciscana TaxID=6661 RepID=UPI0032DBCA14